MNRHQRRAQAAMTGTGHAPTIFRILEKLAQTAVLRASRWVYDGRVEHG